MDKYKHPRAIFNCTHFAAWAIARRMMKLGWHNFRYGFIPPIVIAVSLEAGDPLYEPPAEGDGFELSMFKDGGFLHEEPMNHYIVFQIPGRKGTISINAGYMMHHFVISEKLGYRELARIIKHYKQKLFTSEDKLEEGSTENGNSGSDNDQGT